MQAMMILKVLKNTRARPVLMCLGMQKHSGAYLYCSTGSVAGLR
jgi:hypothetical protein